MKPNSKIVIAVAVSLLTLLILVIGLKYYLNIKDMRAKNGIDEPIVLSDEVRVKPVETEEQAIAIAKEYVDKKYSSEKYAYLDKDFSEFNIKCSLQEDIWYVSYSPQVPEGTVLLGGGGPLVQIEKDSGEVVSCLLQK